jgi:propanediol dehydratase small subunit
MMPSDYPLSEKHPDLVMSPSGRGFRDITLGAVMRGEVGMEDLRVTSNALELQARIAESSGRQQLAENLRRAAELVNVPEQEILAVYSALRPGRANKDGLHKLATDLEKRYGARRCAALIREAADAYGACSRGSKV